MYAMRRDAMRCDLFSFPHLVFLAFRSFVTHSAGRPELETGRVRPSQRRGGGGQLGLTLTNYNYLSVSYLSLSCPTAVPLTTFTTKPPHLPFLPPLPCQLATHDAPLGIRTIEWVISKQALISTL